MAVIIALGIQRNDYKSYQQVPLWKPDAQLPEVDEEADDDEMGEGEAENVAGERQEAETAAAGGGD